MSNNRPLLIVACIVLAIVGGSLWFLNVKQPLPSADAPAVGTAPAPAPPYPAPDPQTLPPPAPTVPKPSAANPSSVASALPARPEAPNPEMTEWEARIDQVLRSTVDENQTAQILVNMLPTLPPEGQEEAAQHISNLILDENYAQVMPLLKNPNLPEEVLDVFVTDLMNREDKVKLPALLEIARLPNHPHHEEALTDLEIFLDEEFGPDWAKWDAAIKAYLKKQAEEEADTP
jgi:hypothetical protein